MIRLADTTVRMYRKKNGLVSLRINSYLMINTNTSFKFHHYLKDISCSITFPDGKKIPMELSYSVYPEMPYKFNTMIHSFSANGERSMKEMNNTLAKFRLDYHINFSGHPSEEPDIYEAIVPAKVITWEYKGM